MKKEEEGEGDTGKVKVWTDKFLFGCSIICHLYSQIKTPLPLSTLPCGEFGYETVFQSIFMIKQVK